MSDFLAAAGVVAIVRALLQNAVTDRLSTALNATPGVTALPPDRVTVGAAEAPQLNVFLYHVSFNQAWRNAELPSRNASGALLSNPPLPLDLHFLISAYGKSEFDGEILLGWAMQVLHENSGADTLADPDDLAGHGGTGGRWRAGGQRARGDRYHNARAAGRADTHRHPRTSRRKTSGSCGLRSRPPTVPPPLIVPRSF